MKFVRSLLQKAAKSKLAKAALIGLSVFGYITFTLRAQELHDNYLFSYVGTSVYFVMSPQVQGGGSAFTLRYKGKTYGITNAHVCRALAGKPLVLISDFYGTYITSQKLISKKYDLCLIEAPQDDHGLSVSTDISQNQTVWAVGHPQGWPLTVSNPGHVIMAKTWEIPAIQGPCPDTLDKSVYQTRQNQFGQVCTLTSNYVQTTVFIDFGSSGSPMVDFYGNVVGVNTIKDGFNYANFITSEDVVNFLEEEVLNVPTK